MKRFSIVFALVGIVLGSCDKEEEVTPDQIKIDYYVDSYNIDGLDFIPQIKVQYEYFPSGAVSKYTVFGYDPNTSALTEQRSFAFTYSAGRVSKIEGVQVNASTPYVTYTYEYQDSKVSRISEVNTSSGINSHADFTYTSEKVKVAYSYSNGGSFQYEFDFATGNIMNDKTTRGSQTCSSGLYTYDTHPSPLSTLGYIDYFLFNMSANNKLTENVNYQACSFPSFIPESYEYTYDNNNFPSKVITHYKGESGDKAERQYFYKM
jgi:hypothetical protein